MGVNGKTKKATEAKKLYEFVFQAAPSNDVSSKIASALEQFEPGHYGGYHWKDQSQQEICELEKLIKDTQTLFGYESPACGQSKQLHKPSSSRSRSGSRNRTGIKYRSRRNRRSGSRGHR